MDLVGSRNVFDVNRYLNPLEEWLGYYGDIMRIGIMSDSHDNIQSSKDALQAFAKKEVQLILHAGDMIGSGNCYIFEGCGMPIKLVYGNNDGDRVGLRRDFERIGGEYLGDFGEVESDGLKIALLHGTEEPMVKAVVSSQIYDIVVRGHNHRAEVARQGKTLIINPGEIWGHFTGRSSVAILDTSNLRVEFIELGAFKTFREILEK